MKKQLIVDYTKTGGSLKIFPKKPLLSTTKPQIKNIHLEYHELSANEVQEHFPAQNVIVILHNPSKKVQRRMNGVCKDEFAKSGEIVISPANVSHYVAWDSEASFSILSLKPKNLAFAAYENIDPDRIELLPFFAQPDPIIYGIGQMLKSQLESYQSISQMYIDQMVSFLFTHLLENYCSTRHKLVETNHTFSAIELQKIHDYFDSHLSKQTGLSDMSSLLGMSENHFGRLFKKSIGVPPAQYFMKRRLKKAAYLLSATDSSIAMIAARTGFSNSSQFCKSFQRHIRVTPRQYRTML